ncbi:hypothetical protein BGZ74_005395, partial [Mortierella antarctica]
MANIQLDIVLASSMLMPTSKNTALNQLDPGSDPPMSDSSASSDRVPPNHPENLSPQFNNDIPSFAQLVSNSASKWQIPDKHFTTNLENAAHDPKLQSCNEDTVRALCTLLNHGLVINMDNSQTSLTHFLVQKLLQPTRLYDLQITVHGNEPMTVPMNTHLLFIHLA